MCVLVPIICGMKISNRELLDNIFHVAGLKWHDVMIQLFYKYTEIK